MHDIVSLIFLIVTILAAIGLIVIIYSRTPSKYTSRFFIMTLILVILYVISHGLHFYMLKSEDVTILDQSCHSLLMLILITLTFFAISYPNQQKIDLKNSLVILVPSITLLFFLWTGNFVQESHAHSDVFEAHYDSMYPIFLMWYVILLFFSLYVLTKKYRNAEDSEIKSQILILIFGLMITNFTSFVFGLFLPWVMGFYYLVEISPLAFLAGLILFTGIGVVKYNMFPNALERVNSFSLQRKIFLSALIAVPIVIVLIQIPLGRVFFGISTPDEWGRYFLISLFGGIIVSITMSFIILKTIAHPIKKLKSQALEIQRGNYGTLVDSLSNDEIGELAFTFNDMSKTLMADLKEIKQKEERISMLMDAFDRSYTSIALVNNSFRIIQANRVFCELNSLDYNNLDELTIDEIQFKDDQSEIFKSIKSELKINKNYEGELNLTLSSGIVKTILLFVTPFEISTGDEPGYLFVEIDITKTKELELQLAQSEKLAAIGKMAAVMAHEVKTPLTSIKMNADILSRSLILNNEDKESFVIINKEINRLNNLVNEILQYSRYTKLSLSNFNFQEIIRTIEFNNKNKYESSSFRIINELDDFEITADKEKLHQVFLNIFENSFESSVNDGYVKIENKITNEGIKIKISDNGKGVPEEIKDRIFDPFYTSKSSGTGLGLSICKKIIEQHNGEIKLLKSQPGFTVFEILLNSINSN